MQPVSLSKGTTLLQILGSRPASIPQLIPSARILWYMLSSFWYMQPFLWYTQQIACYSEQTQYTGLCEGPAFVITIRQWQIRAGDWHLLTRLTRQQVKRGKEVDGLQTDAGGLQLCQVAPLAGQEEQEGLSHLAHPRCPSHSMHISAQALSLSNGQHHPQDWITCRGHPSLAAGWMPLNAALCGSYLSHYPVTGPYHPYTYYSLIARKLVHLVLLPSWRPWTPRVRTSTYSDASPGGSYWIMLVTSGKSRPRAATSVQMSTPALQRENSRNV